MLATFLRAAGAGKLGTSGRMTRTGEHPVPFHLCMNSYTIPNVGEYANREAAYQRTDRAVTTCGLPQSHRGAPSYLKDPAYPGTMSAYEVTTLAPPGPPPFGWTGQMLRQARKHNEPTSLPRSSGLSMQLL